jgi:hypothetical protein
MTGITFKPYATGTMNQPYVDCAKRLARHGGWSQSESDRYLAFAKKAYEGPLDLSHFRE